VWEPVTELVRVPELVTGTELEPALVRVPELVKVLALVSAHSQWLPAQIRPQSR